MVQAASYGASYQTVVSVDVYQDLVAELQETQALARNLEIQNRELWQQNQQLQQELSKFLGAVQNLQQRVPHVSTTVDANSGVTINAPAQRLKTVTTQLATSKSVAIDDEDEESAGSDLSGWNILITVICIIAVGVSVGYTALRPAK